jgi:hypothetical protein
MNITTAERNEIDRQFFALVASEGTLSAGHGWDEEEILKHMRTVCTVTEKYGTIAHNDGRIFRTTVLQFYDRQDLIDFYECEMKLKEEIEMDYKVCAHIDRITLEIERLVNVLDHVDAIKAYYNEGDEEE